MNNMTKHIFPKDGSSFFHVSKRDLGETVTLEPRVPNSSNPEIEGDIPHICVSISVFHCLRSIIGSSYEMSVMDALLEFRDDIRGFESRESWAKRGAQFVSPTIYVTKEIPFIPPDCGDFRNNHEYWFVQEKSFQRIGYLNLEKFKSGTIAISEKENRIEGKLILDKSLDKIIVS